MLQPGQRGCGRQQRLWQAAVGRAGVGGWQVLCCANSATPATLLLQDGTAWLHTFAALMRCCREPPRAVKRRQGVPPSATAAATAGRFPLLASPPAPCASSTASEWLLLLTSGRFTIQGRGALNPGNSRTPSCWAGMAAMPDTELVPTQAILRAIDGPGEAPSTNAGWGSHAFMPPFRVPAPPIALQNFCRLSRRACCHSSFSARTRQRCCRAPGPLAGALGHFPPRRV